MCHVLHVKCQITFTKCYTALYLAGASSWASSCAGGGPPALRPAGADSEEADARVFAETGTQKFALGLLLRRGLLLRGLLDPED